MLFKDLDVPPSATALIGSDRMPEWLAGCFDPAQTLRPHPEWIDVADTIEIHFDSADPSLRGVLALMMAYGRVDECETMLDEISERCGEMHKLLSLAIANGISKEEVDPVRVAVIQIQKYYHDDEDEEEEAEEETLLDRLQAADAAYRAGDRDAALARYRVVADAERDFASGAYHITRAWAALIADAADHEGPAAAGEVWRAARARHDWFPWPGEGGRLIERLLGRGIPDVLAEAVAIRRAQAERGWGLMRQDRAAVAAAQAEISGTAR